MSETSGVVSLRTMREDDLARVLAWRNLPAVATYMYTDHRITEAEHADWFASVTKDGTRRYWIIELDGTPVGLANLYDISTLHRRAYLGLYLADDRVRGMGVGSATDRFLMRHAFEDLGLEKLCAEVLATNEAGIKVHQHHGFQVDGILRRHVVKRDERIDVWTMSLLRDEWTADDETWERP
jgi:UDP-4-amino-4,6-dideoxy-N-acetyl-beta-L-altrosamine N-acetyltransferase